MKTYTYTIVYMPGSSLYRVKINGKYARRREPFEAGDYIVEFLSKKGAEKFIKKIKRDEYDRERDKQPQYVEEYRGHEIMRLPASRMYKVRYKNKYISERNRKRKENIIYMTLWGARRGVRKRIEDRYIKIKNSNPIEI